MKSSRGEIKICDILDAAGLIYQEEYSRSLSEALHSLPGQEQTKTSSSRKQALPQKRQDQAMLLRLL